LKEGGYIMLIVNFSHALTRDQVGEIEELVGKVDRIINVPVQMNLEEPFAPQITAIADRVGLSLEQWRSIPIIVSLPGLAPAAVLLLAELHGRIGHYPLCLRFKQIFDTPPRYAVAEIMDPQHQLNAARNT